MYYYFFPELKKIVKILNWENLKLQKKNFVIMG